jgi:hypothetical protein
VRSCSSLGGQHHSHGIDDAAELYQLPGEIEQVIADEFPAAFDEHIAAWATEAAHGEHHAGANTPTWGLNEAIANHMGDSGGRVTLNSNTVGRG